MRDERDEPPACESCWQPTIRSCKRCGQRICRVCASDHLRWNVDTDKHDKPCVAYERKTIDVWHLFVNYGHGHGWEDEVAELTYREIRDRKREYRENCPQYPTRIVLKRERKPAPAEPDGSPLGTRYTLPPD